ncbi:hypothetical protein L2E82_28196 [Cichorium intybus]|uniref:Uncharacterized protein n=1 Tax=Cichorium intybus TaxID=13427 RepID=A0ACB9CVF0_CICIN|nr:hypothetical protein L2E82_28196 [Cichorium intybus]
MKIGGSKMDAPPSNCSGLHRLSHQIFYVSPKTLPIYTPFPQSIHRPFTILIYKHVLLNESAVFFVFSGRIRPDSPWLVSFSDLVSAAASPVSSLWRCNGGDNRRRGYDSSTAGVFTRNTNSAISVKNFRFVPDDRVWKGKDVSGMESEVAPEYLFPVDFGKGKNVLEPVSVGIDDVTVKQEEIWSMGFETNPIWSDIGNYELPEFGAGGVEPPDFWNLGTSGGVNWNSDDICFDEIGRQEDDSFRETGP